MSEWTILCPGPSLATYRPEDIPSENVVAVNAAAETDLPHNYWCFIDDLWYWRNIWCGMRDPEKLPIAWCKSYYTDAMEAMGYRVEGFSLTSYPSVKKCSVTMAMAQAYCRHGAKKITLYGCDMKGGPDENRWEAERKYVENARGLFERNGVEIVRVTRPRELCSGR